MFCFDLPTAQVIHISSGNRRFAKLHNAVQEGHPKPPMDLRYLSKSQFGRDNTSEGVTEVISFLEKVYTSIAENMPDMRDDTWDVATDNATAVDDVDDPYSLNIGIYPVSEEKTPKTKQHQRGVTVAPGRTVADGCEERWLPNGTMKEYWTQFCAQNPTAKVSFPTFWRVPGQWMGLVYFFANSLCMIFQFQGLLLG